MIIDAAPINEKQAAFLMWYHLRQAASLFEILPGSILIHRKNFMESGFFSDEVMDPIIDSQAGMAFIDKLIEWYDTLE